MGSSPLLDEHIARISKKGGGTAQKQGASYHCAGGLDRLEMCPPTIQEKLTHPHWRGHPITRDTKHPEALKPASHTAKLWGFRLHIVAGLQPTNMNLERVTLLRPLCLHTPAQKGSAPLLE